MKVFAATLIAFALVASPAGAAAPGHAPAVAARPAVAQRDWSAVVTRAPAGAYVLGNPQAKVRVVEYASLTCSHCAAFSAEGLPALRRDLVRRGLVNLELRHAVRDPADLAASLLARCAGPRGYFPAVERMFAAQAGWLPKAATALDAASGGDTPAARAATLTAVANAAGLPALAGLSAPVAARCLAAPADQAVLTAMAKEAWATRRIAGTPAFLVNDVAVDGNDWASLQPGIAAALR